MLLALKHCWMRIFQQMPSCVLQKWSEEKRVPSWFSDLYGIKRQVWFCLLTFWGNIYYTFVYCPCVLKCLSTQKGKCCPFFVLFTYLSLHWLWLQNNMKFCNEVRIHGNVKRGAMVKRVLHQLPHSSTSWNFLVKFVLTLSPLQPDLFWSNLHYWSEIEKMYRYLSYLFNSLTQLLGL